MNPTVPTRADVLYDRAVARVREAKRDYAAIARVDFIILGLTAAGATTFAAFVTAAVVEVAEPTGAHLLLVAGLNGIAGASVALASGAFSRWREAVWQYRRAVR